MPNNDTILQKLDNLANEISSLKAAEKTMYTNKEMLEILDVTMNNALRQSILVEFPQHFF